MLILGDYIDGMTNAGVTRCYGLVLNMMRDRMERADLVALADSRDELLAFVREETTEPYTDEGTSGFDGCNQKFHKAFRKGGPLEWYNPANLDGPPDPHYGHGIVTLELRPKWVQVA
jgi:hypothetical protein